MSIYSSDKKHYKMEIVLSNLSIQRLNGFQNRTFGKSFFFNIKIILKTEPKFCKIAKVFTKMPSSFFRVLLVPASQIVTCLVFYVGWLLSYNLLLTNRGEDFNKDEYLLIANRPLLLVTETYSLLFLTSH